MRILVVNAGSSSVKLRVISDDDQIEVGCDLGPPGDGLGAELADFLATAGAIDAVGHRVVHGGDRFLAPAVVAPDVRRTLTELEALAPLHNPPAMAGIDAVNRLLPTVPAVACFDTTFHATMSPAATTYALPHGWAQRWGIRRFGFHGLSCAWALRRAVELLGTPRERLRLIICHLGSGASVTAVAAGRSVDTTMGFTPLEGLVMATRAGDVDPGVLVWALNHGLSVAELSEAIDHRAGLFGMSGGRTGDLRELLALRSAGDQVAGAAIAVYLHRLRSKIAAMAAATEGTDALIFTGGVGEHAAPIRHEAAVRLGWLGVSVDEARNAGVGQADSEISTPGSTVRTLVVHAREDLEIAQECRRLLG